MEQSKNLRKQAEQVEEFAHFDLAVPAVILGLSTIFPPLSFLSSLAPLISTSRKKRAEQLLRDVASDLETVKERLDSSEYVKTDQFMYLLVGCLKGVLDEYREEKMEYYRKLLVQSVLRQDIEQEPKEYYLSLIDRMNSLHIRMFELVRELYERTQQQVMNPYRGDIEVHADDMARFPDLHTDDCFVVLEDLERFGLIIMRAHHPRLGTSVSIDLHKSVFGTTVVVALTESGFNFHGFLTS